MTIFVRSAFVRSTLALSVTLLMTACATGQGDFGSTAIELPNTSQPNNNINAGTTNTPAEPQLQDVPTPPRTQEEVAKIMQPALGYEVALLENNMHSEATKTHIAFDGDNIIAINADPEKINQQHIQKLTASERANDAQGDDPTQIAGTHNHRDNFYPSRNREYMQFVKSGWIANTLTKQAINFSADPKGSTPPKTVWRGMEGFVFYQGKNPAKSLPDEQTVSYKGTWDFATDAKKGRNFPIEGIASNHGYKDEPGSRYSALSMMESSPDDTRLRTNNKTEPVSHESQFSVNFGEKSLTGKLVRNKGTDEKIDRYSIDAKLQGNRFVGVAKASKSDDAFFGQDSDTLEGGFFGDNAEELAGKFLAKDNSLFAVFAARQHTGDKFASENDIAKTTKAFDAVQFAGIDAKETDGFNTTAEQMDTFGDATKLVIDGKSYSLLPDKDSQDNPFVQNKKYPNARNDSNLIINACCSNLSYLKFGNYFFEANDQKSNAHLFLTGERTSLKEMMAQNAKAKYQGTWEAYVLNASNQAGSVSPVQGQSGAKAMFDVDFGAKTLTGSLYQNNGAKPSIMIENGKIDANGFSASFKTNDKGFILDTATGNGVQLSGKVNGGFYGPNAVELGGYFSSDNTDDKKDKISGVFGAKKQQSVSR